METAAAAVPERDDCSRSRPRSTCACFSWDFAAFGTIILIFHLPALQTWAARIGFGAALGGATGNLIDWLRRGAVLDFIDLRIWPVFNLADVFIALGMGVALWSLW